MSEQWTAKRSEALRARIAWECEGVLTRTFLMTGEIGLSLLAAYDAEKARVAAAENVARYGQHLLTCGDQDVNPRDAEECECGFIQEARQWYDDIAGGAE